MNRVLEKIASIFGIVVSFALAGVVVYMGYFLFYGQISSFVLILLLLLGGILSSIVCCVFHELGHIVFGYCNGFRFNSIRIGFIKIYREDGSIHVTCKDLPESLAGAAEMLPKNAQNLYAKYLRTIFGGLLFSFLFLIGALISVIFSKQLPFAAYIFLCTAMPYAFYIFYCNALPFNDDNMDTDGAMLRGLLKKETSYLTAVNILAIEGYLYQGLTPGEIDKELYFGLPQLPEDDLNFILLTSYRLMYYLDLGKYDLAVRASDRLESLLEYVPKFYKNDILAEILFVKCYLVRDREAAQKVYGALKLYLKGENTLQTHRILAAYELCMNSNITAALRELNAAEEKAENYAIKGIKKYEHKFLMEIRKEIHDRAAEE